MKRCFVLIYKYYFFVRCFINNITVSVMFVVLHDIVKRWNCPVSFMLFYAFNTHNLSKVIHNVCEQPSCIT